MKIVINKLVGDLGEQWAIEIPVPSDVLKGKDPVAAIKAISFPALRAVDDRLLELNMRLLDRNQIAQKLTPEANLALQQTIEVMYGRRVVLQAPEEVGPQPTVLPKGDIESNLERALEATDEGGR